MSRNQVFVIIGGGLAGATAAKQLRKSGFDGHVHLIAEESHRPYLRPPLSKEFLLGRKEREKIDVQPSDWYHEQHVELAIGTKVASFGDHTLTLETGHEMPFDRLLLATGASPRRLNVPGASAKGIHYLRTVEDSQALRSAFTSGGKRVVFIGSGWIGLELAAAARTYGNEVTVVGPDKIPLSNALGDELGAMFQDLHESNGVEFKLETNVLGFEQSDGRVAGVLTDHGTVPADLVVVGIGAVPNTALAQAAGLTIDNGILVDQHLATSAQDVFAAGDVANAYHPFVKQPMRNEHWATAIASGKVAAKSMLGEDASLDDVPYFYTDQYDLGMEYSGFPPLIRGANVVYRGDRSKREFIAFWLKSGVVVAGMNVNVWDVNEQVQALIKSARAVDEAHLADQTIDLASI